MSYENTGGYKIRNQNAPHFLTFTIVGWIDLLTRKEYKDLILQSFEHCRKEKGLKIYAFVIMNNHIHTIWFSEIKKLSDIIRDFKSYTCKALINKILESKTESRKEWLLYMFRYFANGTNANEEYKIWISGSHPEEIFTNKFFYQKLDYIHENPVRAKWVESPEEYLYSSARNFCSRTKVFEIDNFC